MRNLNNVRSLISKAKFEKALRVLSRNSIVRNEIKFQNDLSILQARYSEEKSKEIKGISDSTVEKYKIINSILEFTTLIEAKSNSSTKQDSKEYDTVLLEDIENRVKKSIASKNRLDEKELNQNTKLIGEKLNLDALDFIELIMNLEKEFNIAVPDEDTEKLVLVKDAIALIYNSTVDSKFKKMNFPSQSEFRRKYLKSSEYEKCKNIQIMANACGQTTKKPIDYLGIMLILIILMAFFTGKNPPISVVIIMVVAIIGLLVYVLKNFDFKNLNNRRR